MFIEKLFAETAVLLNTKPDQLRIDKTEVVSQEGQRIALAEIYERLAAEGKKLDTYFYYDPPETFPLRESADHEPGLDVHKFDIHYAYCFGAQAAVVEVDENTGEVKVLKIAAAQDAGNSILKQSTSGQVEGAVMMGLGYALMENFVQKDGQVVTGNLLKLKVPMIQSAPEMETIIVEKAAKAGPFGAKGMGEVPVNPTAPAIISAIHDATGVWINRLPATKEEVLAAIKARRGV